MDHDTTINSTYCRMKTPLLLTLHTPSVRSQKPFGVVGQREEANDFLFLLALPSLRTIGLVSITILPPFHRVSPPLFFFFFFFFWILGGWGPWILDCGLPLCTFWRLPIPSTSLCRCRQDGSKGLCSLLMDCILCPTHVGYRTASIFFFIIISILLHLLSSYTQCTWIRNRVFLGDRTKDMLGGPEKDGGGGGRPICLPLIYLFGNVVGNTWGEGGMGAHRAWFMYASLCGYDTW